MWSRTVISDAFGTMVTVISKDISDDFIPSKYAGKKHKKNVGHILGSRQGDIALQETISDSGLEVE
jgi:hypothetical protein